jgi:hypothetical protein
MYFIYECAACVLVTTIGMALLFTACVIVLVFKERCANLAQTFRKLRDGALLLLGRRMAAESRDS